MYWKGHAINRYGREYQLLLDQAYDALCQNADFADALCRSHGKILFHSAGKQLNKKKTVLTAFEFCGILTRKRRKLLKKGGKRNKEKVEINVVLDHSRCGRIPFSRLADAGKKQVSCR